MTSCGRAAPNRCEVGLLFLNYAIGKKKRFARPSPGTALKVRNTQHKSHEPFGSRFPAYILSGFAIVWIRLMQKKS